MKKTIISTLVAIIALCLCLGGCGSPEKDIIGTWENSTSRPSSMALYGEFFPSEIEFFEDGILTDYSMDGPADGNYSLSDNRLKITVNYSALTSYSWNYDCEIHGGTMKLTSSEGNTVEYEKAH